MASPASFPATTKQFSLPLLFAGQAQKEFFINQSFAVIDAMLGRAVVQSVSSPPSSTQEGDCFRITAPAQNEWTAHEDQLAIRIGSGWHFIEPKRGMTIFDQEAETVLHYNSGWNAAEAPLLPATGATIDAELRTAFSELIQALRAIGIFTNPAY